MTIEIIPMDTTVFTIAVGFSCGAIHEEPSLSGISHLLEHMIFKGDSSESSITRFRALQDTGAMWNAVTSHDNTIFYLSCGVDYAPDVIQIMEKNLNKFRPTLNQLTIEKRVVLEERALAFSDVEPDIFDIMHANTPYGASIIGTIDTVQGITLDQITRYYNKHYRQPHVVIVCPRKFHSACETLIYKKFPTANSSCNNQTLLDLNMTRILDTKLTRVVTHVAASLPAAKKQKTHEVHQAIEDCELGILGFPANDFRSDICYLVAFILKIRFFEEARIRKGLVYGIRVQFTPYLLTGFLEINFKSSKGTCVEVLTIIKSQIKYLFQISRKDLGKYHKDYIASKLVQDSVTICVQAVKDNMYGANANMYGANANNNTRSNSRHSLILYEFYDTVKILFRSGRVGIKCTTACKESDILKLIDFSSFL